MNFVLTNVGSSSLTWLAGSPVPWLNMSSSGGAPGPGASANVTVSLNGVISNLSLGSCIGTVWFTNSSDGAVQSRQFTVTTGNPGFENGSFQGWTLGGDNSYTFVGIRSIGRSTFTLAAMRPSWHQRRGWHSVSNVFHRARDVLSHLFLAG